MRASKTPYGSLFLLHGPDNKVYIGVYSRYWKWQTDGYPIIFCKDCQLMRLYQSLLPDHLILILGPQHSQLLRPKQFHFTYGSAVSSLHRHSLINMSSHWDEYLKLLDTYDLDYPSNPMTSTISIPMRRV